jgi:hypothetical protein
MTLPELVQLYTPIAGLVAFAFGLGGVWMLVLQLKDAERARIERERATDKDIADLVARMEALEAAEHERRERERLEQSDRDRLVRLETITEGIRNTIDKMERELATANRQLANIVTGRGGKVVEFREET